MVALLLVQSAIFIYWVDRPGERNPRHAQLLRVIGAAAALGDAFERGGPVDVAAIVGAQADRGGPLYVVLADGTALAPGDRTVPEGVRQTACSASSRGCCRRRPSCSSSGSPPSPR